MCWSHHKKERRRSKLARVPMRPLDLGDSTTDKLSELTQNSQKLNFEFARRVFSKRGGFKREMRILKWEK